MQTIKPTLVKNTKGDQIFIIEIFFNQVSITYNLSIYTDININSNIINYDVKGSLVLLDAVNFNIVSNFQRNVFLSNSSSPLPTESNIYEWHMTTYLMRYIFTDHIEIHNSGHGCIKGKDLHVFIYSFHNTHPIL